MKNRSSNEDDEELMTTNRKASSSEFDPQSMITSVFEPHIVRFVRRQSHVLSYICLTHSNFENNQVRVEEEALHKVLLEISFVNIFKT